MAIARDLGRRYKLPQYNTLKDLTELLKESKNVIVLTGAGVGLPILLHERFIGLM
jgi:NAD-dependent histone deacetylase SIR2